MKGVLVTECGLSACRLLSAVKYYVVEGAMFQISPEMLSAIDSTIVNHLSCLQLTIQRQDLSDFITGNALLVIQWQTTDACVL